MPYYGALDGHLGGQFSYYIAFNVYYVKGFAQAHNFQNGTLKVVLFDHWEGSSTCLLCDYVCKDVALTHHTNTSADAHASATRH